MINKNKMGAAAMNRCSVVRKKYLSKVKAHPSSHHHVWLCMVWTDFIHSHGERQSFRTTKTPFATIDAVIIA